MTMKNYKERKELGSNTHIFVAYSRLEEKVVYRGKCIDIFEAFNVQVLLFR